MVHALGERLPGAGGGEVDRRLHLNANLVSTAGHDRLSARFHSKAVECVCVRECMHVYMCVCVRVYARVCVCV